MFGVNLYGLFHNGSHGTFDLQVFPSMLKVKVLMIISGMIAFSQMKTIYNWPYHYPLPYHTLPHKNIIWRILQSKIELAYRYKWCVLLVK